MHEFNQMPDQAARELLRGCCSSARWATLVAGGRPYPGRAAVLAASNAAVDALGEADLREALAGHPRLGDRPASASPSGAGPGGEQGWTSREQAGVRSGDAASQAALESGNADYELQFGHLYLACATGRSAAELAAFLRERLGSEPEREWQVVAGELAAINRIRLEQLFGGPGGER
ncbi:MAG: 2-oxo-4-hydroxy-4-carboxy-5-ureidoimidazoline decarboxylase [Streptosporangiaceae bacterium]